MSDDNRLVPIRKMSDDDLGEKIMSDYIAAKGDKDGDFIRARRYRNIYQALNAPDDVIDESSGHAVIDDKSKYSDTYLAIGASTVDTAAASLYNHFFPNNNYFTIEADDWEDEIYSHKITAHLKKRHKEMGFKTKTYEALQSALCFDYCVTLTTWKIRPGYVRKRKVNKTHKKVGGVQIPYQEVKIETEWVPNAVDRSDFQVIDYFNCAHDIKSKNGFEDSAFFIDWYYIPFEEFMMKSQTKDSPWGKYKNVENAIKKQFEGSDRQGSDPDDPVYRGSGRINNRLMIIRYWTHDQVAEYCNGYIVRRTNLDGMPLQLWKIYTLPAEFKGMGIVQRIERNQKDVNAIINIKRDFQNLQLNPIVVIDEDLLLTNEGDMELYAGKTITSSGGNVRDKVQFHQPGIDMSQGATEELGVQVDMIDRTTGFGVNADGSYSKGRKTARETTVVAAGSLSKVAQIAGRLEEGALEPAYLRMFLLEQMNLTQEETFKYMGPEGVTWLKIKPEDYRWKSMPRFEAKGSSYLVNKEVSTQQFLLAMDRQMQYAPQMANLSAMFAKMWELLDPKDYLNFIKDPREKSHNVPQNIENAMMAMGHNVEISPENNHQEHLSVIDGFMRSPEYLIWPESFKLKMEAHKAQHEQAGQPQAGQQQTGIPGQDQGLTNQDQSDVARGQRGVTLQ